MSRVGKLGVASLLVGAALLALSLGVGAAGRVDAATTMQSEPMTHEQMEQMMDAMHGAGTSGRMHEAMGVEGEAMMDQCMAMMGMMMDMMSGMPGMMDSPMPGMMPPDGMPDMMGR